MNDSLSQNAVKPKTYNQPSTSRPNHQIKLTAKQKKKKKKKKNCLKRPLLPKHTTSQPNPVQNIKLNGKRNMKNCLIRLLNPKQPTSQPHPIPNIKLKWKAKLNSIYSSFE